MTTKHHFAAIAFDDLDHVAGGAGEGGLSPDARKLLFNGLSDWYSRLTGLQEPGTVPQEGKQPYDSNWYKQSAPDPEGYSSDYQYAGGEDDDG